MIHVEKWKTAIDALTKDGVGVIPTDTIYGLAASAFSPAAVERIYGLKGRDTEKKCIVLIRSLEDFDAFQATADEAARDFLARNWPGPVSVELCVEGDGLSHLHRGTGSFAFRMPDSAEIMELLSETGPLVSTSANPQGARPAATVEEARRYFEDAVDFYVDAGPLALMPSTVVDLRDGTAKVVRQGAKEVIM